MIKNIFLVLLVRFIATGNSIDSTSHAKLDRDLKGTKAPKVGKVDKTKPPKVPKIGKGDKTKPPKAPKALTYSKKSASTCASTYIFSTTAELQTAAGEWCTNSATAMAKYGNITSCWDTSQITNMESIFNTDTNTDCVTFNEPLNWDTSAVGRMFSMFNGARAFNQALAWDTSKVSTMRYMFSGATAFNQVLTFDTSAVSAMDSMFSGATAFNQALAWDTSEVFFTSNMFNGATAFNQALCWDTTCLSFQDSMFTDSLGSLSNYPACLSA